MLGDRCLKALPTSGAMGKHITDLFNRSKVPTGQENESRLAQLLTEFGDEFSKGQGDLGKTNVMTHRIDVGSATPIMQQPRRIPMKQREETAKLIQEMEEQGVIEPLRPHGSHQWL